MRTPSFAMGTVVACLLLAGGAISQEVSKSTEPLWHSDDLLTNLEDTSDGWPAGDTVVFPEPLPTVPAIVIPEETTARLERFRKGALQRASLSTAWIARGGSEGVGQTTVDTSLSLACPLGSMKHFLVVTPGFQADFVDGPDTIDVPARLYSAGVDFMWRGQLHERWSMMLGVRPAWTSDFVSTDQALRFSGRALASWQCVPDRLTLIFGVVVLNLDGVMVLPAAGLLWTPDNDWRVDLVFPRPKVARRLSHQAGVWENWLYGAGQIGGQTWAVRRDDGRDDLLTLRDYRLSVGLEHVRQGGSGGFVEVGWVFGRQLEYESLPDELDLGMSILLQAGVQY